MPPAPTLDYYTELELDRSASSQAVTSSFRRLAMIHHPDRNPDNQQEATARFQRLQLAYETLSDPTKRSRYYSPRPTASSPFFDFDGGDDDDDDAWDDGIDNLYDFFQQFASGFAFGGTFDFSSHRNFNFSYEYNRSRHEEMEELRRFQEQYREIFHEQRRRREEAEEARLNAKRAAKNNADLAKEAQKNYQRGNEQEKQERRWKELNAITKDERFNACLHSDFCKKNQQQKKFKCSACSAKRGLIAFQCPYCSAFLCQLCVTNFADRRKSLYKSSGPNVTATSQKPQNHAEDLDAANNDKAANGDETTSANPPSSQKSANNKKKKTNKKNKPKPVKAEATGTPARTDPTKSNQKATAAAEPQGATAVPTPQQKKAAAGAGNASYHKVTIDPDVVNGKDDKAETKFQDPTTGPKRTHQHKNPRFTAKPISGATRGFIRNTMPVQGAPEALLRQAIEQFGTVASLKIKNKYVGNAHVEFSDHSGLCKAMAASPVVVNDHVAVEVVELKDCSKCGRFGHMAGQCRSAKAPGRRGHG